MDCWTASYIQLMHKAKSTSCDAQLRSENASSWKASWRWPHSQLRIMVIRRQNKDRNVTSSIMMDNEKMKTSPEMENLISPWSR